MNVLAVFQGIRDIARIIINGQAWEDGKKATTITITADGEVFTVPANEPFTFELDCATVDTVNVNNGSLIVTGSVMGNTETNNGTIKVFGNVGGGLTVTNGAVKVKGNVTGEIQVDNGGVDVLGSITEEVETSNENRTIDDEVTGESIQRAAMSRSSARRGKKPRTD